MLTFEEFFKKKKIDLVQLERAEPALFAEFQSHYGQMGEKSFDHTKKYWFNNLRRLYHTVDEPKVEKVKMENQIAEQTVTESVSEQPETAKPKVGFTPKFKAATKPPVETALPIAEPPVTTEDAPATPAKLGFKPKFKTATSAAPEDVKPADPVSEEPQAEAPTVAAAPKLGFKPKFKTATSTAGDAQMPSAETPVANAEQRVDEEEKTVQPVSTPPKLGFKPKFKTAGSPSIEKVEVKSEESATGESEQTPIHQETTAEAESASTPPKLGFKPKFKTATKPVEDVAPTPEVNDEPLVAEPEQPEAKPAYKPRFQMKNMKPKTEEGD